MFQKKQNIPVEQKVPEKQKIPKEQDLMNNLGKISYMLDKTHLMRLDEDFGVLPFDDYYNRDELITYKRNIRAVQVKRCVIDKEEKVADCFNNILSVFANSENSLALVINRKPTDIEMYYVIKNIGSGRNTESEENSELLAESIRGNLPGTEVKVIYEKNEGIDTEKLFHFDEAVAVSILSNIPSEKSEDFVSQGLEKLLNGIIPKKDEDSYTIVLLAESLPLLQVRSILSGYEELATAIAPFSGYQFQSGINETDTKGEMESLAHSDGISHAIAKTHSVNVGVNGGMFSSVTDAITNSIMRSVTNSIATTSTKTIGDAVTKSPAGALASGGQAVGAIIGSAIGSIVPGLGTYIGGLVGGFAGNVVGALVGSKTKSEAYSEGITKLTAVTEGTQDSTSKAIAKGKNFGGSLGYGFSRGTIDTTSETDTQTRGTNKSISLGTSENTMYTYKSYVVSDLIAKLEATIKRIDESKANGLWRYGAYIFSKDPTTTKNAANFLRAISQGEASHIEPAFIQTWLRETSKDLTAFGEISKYVKHFTHPVFGALTDGRYVMTVTPTSDVSTTELANVFAFPRHALNSLPVIECARFGREPHSLIELPRDPKETVEIGCAYHMHLEEEKNRIKLSKEELKTHTFITGSTGSGKSNTIYTLLAELCPEDSGKINFLVIEPAKGEYKDVFGGRKDVEVYGTNPFKAPNLLKINPFSFPPDIHVLEHIDRLVEVFNACWPMYAAMPAILKESVEKAYEFVGWNLKTSKYPGEFPTFNTLMTVLPKVIDTSAYSADTSNDYKGALLTRVRSLTTGIQGQILGLDTDIVNEALFNKNVIVDLSRVGSSETKALLMGVLVLKLQEFRISESEEKDKKTRNKKLHHITVLEEAHHLLRRTSTEQSQESSNLQGKSVEMLANAIAEMRTYGEGFIIADQSPGLMDMSVIRNTNTKIILRLPDESDRMLVGKAAGLSDIQVSELSRLKCGVAAISQSGWLEPVLCKIDEFEKASPMVSRYSDKPEFQFNDKENAAIKQFLNTAFDVEQTKLSTDTVEIIRKWISRMEMSDKARTDIERVLAGHNLSGRQQMLLIGRLFGTRIRTIPVRETAVSEVQKLLIGQYDFKEGDEIIRRINDLFLLHSANIYTTLPGSIENTKGGIR